MQTTPTPSIREPAFAGTFYPNDPSKLSAMLSTYLSGEPGETCPKAIIAPHAGYIYSGETAGRVYRRVAAGRAHINRVILLGPSHRVAFRGMAAPSSDYFRTPLGDIPLDTDLISELAQQPGISFLDKAHAQEHSLEVHLPFLQQVLNDFTLVPVVVGDAAPDDVATMLASVWGGDETLIVISSDLSHFEAYDRARQIDQHTNQKILGLDASLQGPEACGCRPVNGLLHLLKQKGLTIRNVDICNSGDTAGDRDRVVGYGAWEVIETMTAEANMTTEGRIEEWTLAERQTLIQIAREAIRSPLEGEKNYNINLRHFNARLQAERATFVTLNLNGRLRGCIGSLAAHRALVVDVASNAQAAAFKDPRFSKLTHAEYQQVDVHISVLTKPRPMTVSSREELIEKLTPGLDGLVLKQGANQATYLPSVWSQIPDPARFVSELRRKAGLPGEGWSDEMTVQTYRTEEFC